MYATSRDALVGSRAALSSAIESASSDSRTAVAAQAGADLFAAVEVLDGARTLRRALTDGSSAEAGRVALVDQIFSGKVGDAALSTLKDAVSREWSAPRDLLDSLVRLGRESLLIAAEDQDQLGTVEDELFRLGRIVTGDETLERTLSDRGLEAARKRELLAKLLYGKVTAVSEALALQAVGRLRGATPSDAFDELSDIAAAQRKNVVANVTSSAALSEAQRGRLAEALGRLYGKTVTMHVEVDPELRGGLVVRVGDEVIDGSAAGRLASLRSMLR